MRTHASAPKPSAVLLASAVEKFGIFCNGFAAVAAIAQTLQIAIQEQLHIAAVWDHVVSNGRLDTQPMPGTLSTERLAGQLSTSASSPTISWVDV